MRSWMTAWAGILILSIAPAAAHAATADLPTGFTLKGEDTLVHQASGTEFPMRVEGFTRELGKASDLVGNDIVISYRETIAGQPVVARFALIQIADMSPKEHYLGIKSLVGAYFQTLSVTAVEPQGEGPFTPPGMSEGSGYQGRFKALHDGTPYELSLSTVKLGPWDVRLTAAYPASASAEARDHILRLAAILKRTAPATK